MLGADRSPPRGARPDTRERLRRHLERVLPKLDLPKESRIEAGHVISDHAHTLIAIPPKYAVSQLIGSIVGKSAIWRVHAERKRASWEAFWARGQLVSTVSQDEAPIRADIRCQKQEDRRLDLLGLWR